MNSLKRYKYFVIDEIGMISNQLWDYLMLLKKTNPKAIFILIGDWRQLPPIEEGRIEELDVFNHPIVRFLCNGNSIELNERQRYDVELWDYLERGIENDDWSGLKQEVIKYDDIYSNKSICYFNKTRVRINKICMEHFKEETENIYLEHKLEDIKDKRQSVYLYEGLPIMAWKNCVKLGIVNSEEFVVNNFDDDKIYITREEGGEDLEINIDDFHNYFVPNYCATTHKSQGATYKDKVILWDWDRMITNKKVVYTACSRATKFDNLVISTGLE
jgi:ATP-dependent exoDNAse (exonuclease V) alpha subunit